MVEKNKDRTCSTCEHIDLEEYEEPCLSCNCINGGIYTNYTPKKRIKYYPAASTYRIVFPRIKHVIFNGPATIVFWQDDTKTVVKCREGDTFDPEKGLAMAIAKKALGNEDGYYEDIKKWLPKEKKEEAFEKKCGNCKYADLHYTAEPCFSCGTAAYNGKGSKTKWEPKEKPVKKTCEACRYDDPCSFGFSLVCSLCNDYEYWEPTN